MQTPCREHWPPLPPGTQITGVWLVLSLNLFCKEQSGLASIPPDSRAGYGSAGLRISSPVPPLLCVPRLLSKILSECEDADEIEYLVDGSWCPIRAEKERSCSPQCPILVLGEFLARSPTDPSFAPNTYSGGLVVSEFDLCPAL